MMGLQIGSQNITADGVVGTSGKPVRVFEFIVRSTSDGGAAVAVYNGTSTGGTKYDDLNGTTSLTVRIPYVGGLLFPGGCYLDIDANTSYVTVIYTQEAN